MKPTSIPALPKCFFMPSPYSNAILTRASAFVGIHLELFKKSVGDLNSTRGRELLRTARSAAQSLYRGLTTGSVMKAFPHSTHAAFDRGVINPHAGHILCAAYPAICGRNHRV